MADARERYDPAHDLAVIFGSALHMGYHGPAARAALRRLTEALDVNEFTPVSTVERLLRERLAALFLGPRLPADDLRAEFEAGVEERMADFAPGDPDIGALGRALARRAVPEPPDGPVAGYSGAI